MESTSRSLLKSTQAQRSGFHATVYEIIRDPDLKNKNIIRDKSTKVFPFVNGSTYKGEWKGDKKDGFGIQINPDNTKYEGEWMNNRPHGRGTLWVKVNNGSKFTRRYVGQWFNGVMHGEGIYYYENGEVYRGQWSNNLRSGEGTLQYKNDDKFVGNWLNDLQDGIGTMNYANGNVYEGVYSAGKKEGPGLFYYSSTRKIYEGEWADDQPRCGEYRPPTVEEINRFSRPLPKGMFVNEYDLPELKLSDPAKVLSAASTELRLRGAAPIDDFDFAQSAEGAAPFLLQRESVDNAQKVFYNISNGKHTISIFRLGEVLNEFGLTINSNDVNDIIQQLEMKETMDITFSEAIDIANFIAGEY